MGLSCHSKSLTGLRSRYLVRGLRPAVFMASRFFAVSLVVTEATTPSLGLDSPSGFTVPRPLESCAVPMALMGFCCLSRHPFGSAVSRIPTLVPPSARPKSRRRRASSNFPTRRSEPRQEGVALQSVSPAQSRDLSVPCPLAVSDIESFCSEDQRVTMPRSFRALLPARIRSLRPAEAGCGSMLSWAFSSHRAPVLRLRPSRLPDSPRG
jgi:hypothetical protein